MHGNVARRLRRRSALQRLLVLAISGVLAASVTSTMPFKAAADGDSGGGLRFIGFVHGSQFDCGFPCSPRGDELQMVGVSDALNEVVAYDKGLQRIFTLDPQTLTQTGMVVTPGFSGTTTVLDPSGQTMYIGGQVSYLPGASNLGVDGQSPRLATVNLVDHSSSIYTFPDTPGGAAGDSIVALATAHPPGGDPEVFALLYQDTSGTGAAGVEGTTRDLTLYALDATKLVTDPANAQLWSYPIRSCASVPSWTVAQQQDFLGIDRDGRFAYFACRGFSETGTGTGVMPAGAVLVNFPTAFPHSASGISGSFYPQGLNSNFARSGGDTTAGLLFIASTGTLDKVYVFDTRHRAWTGSVPFDQGKFGQNLWGTAVNEATAETYAAYQQDYLVAVQATQLPVPQGHSLSLGDLFIQSARSAPVVDPATRRIFIAGVFEHAGCIDSSCDHQPYPDDDAIAVYEDTSPPPPPMTPADPDSLTHDLPITADTPVTYGTFATSYGARAIEVGGLHSSALGDIQLGGNGVGPQGVVSAMCNLSGKQLCLDVPSTSDGDRAVTFGKVSQTETSNSASTANATPIELDAGTQADASALSSYDPQNLLTPYEPEGTPSAGSPPPPPALPDQLSEQLAPATCADLGDGKKSNATPGAVATCDGAAQQTSAGAAAGACAGNAPGGAPAGSCEAPPPVAQAAAAWPTVEVGYAGSATRVAHTPNNDAVTEATAVARGIALAIPGGPTVSIGEVAASAASTASGVTGSATSSFSRRISSVIVRDPTGNIAFACGFDGVTVAGAAATSPSCDPRQLSDQVSQYSEFPVQFRTPAPDDTPTVTGSPGGAQAEVTKSPYEFWDDFFTNADSGYEVPGLQIVVVGDANQPSRMVLDLAGVHVESHDAIGLAPPPAPPLPDPTLKLSLTDGSTPAVPLAGGQFALVADDGTTAATCSTAADGIGSCSFPDVKPGNYTIKETTAPPGYAIAPDYQLSLDPGQDYTATFVNLLAIGAVHVALTSAVDKSPLSGATFAMYAGSSTLGTPVATCTTGKDGTCGFTKVPLASYTMHQQSAPKGFLAADDYPFDLTDPGQDATLTFVDGTPAVQAAKGRFIPGKPAVPPHTEVVGGSGQGLPAVPAAYSTSTNNIPPVVSSAPTARAPVVAGLPQRLADLPAQLAKLLTHSPQQAVLLLFMWLVFGMPIYLWARRRQLLSATEGT